MKFLRVRGRIARHDNLRGILAMTGAVAMFVLMDAAMKLLADRYPAMQVAALRGLAALPLVLAYVAWRGAAASLLRIRWPLHVLRGVLGVLMLWLFVLALKSLPLTEAYTLFFIAPMLIVALSVLLLREHVGWARWMAMAAGMAGVLVALRPSGGGLWAVGSLAALAAAVCYAAASIAVRVLGRTDSAESMVFWLTLMVGAGAGLLAAPDWVRIPPADLPLIAGLGISAFIGQLWLTEAFRQGDVSAVAPFEYTALAWGAAADWLLWSAVPDRWTLAGAAIIAVSGVYLAGYEKARDSETLP